MQMSKESDIKPFITSKEANYGNCTLSEMRGLQFSTDLEALEIKLSFTVWGVYWTLLGRKIIVNLLYFSSKKCAHYYGLSHV